MKNSIVFIIRDPNFLIFQVAELEKPATERSKRRDEKAGATYIKLGARGRLQDELYVYLPGVSFARLHFSYILF